MSSSFFFLQSKAPKEIHAILTETLGEHAPSYGTVKNWVAQFKRGDFSTCGAPRPGQHKTVTTPEIIDQIQRTNFWIFLSGLQKLQQRAKKCIELRGEYVE